MALQIQVSAAAEQAGLVVRRLGPAGVEALAGVGEIAWVDAELRGDLLAARDFLVALDRQRPVVLVRRFDMTGGEGARPDRNLTLILSAGRVRAEGEDGA